MADEKKINDGGPAFPVELAFDKNGEILGGVQTDISSGWATGMSLRDWFAGQALAGLLASGMTYGGSSTNRGAVANDAYAHADAMIAVRKGGAK